MSEKPCFVVADIHGRIDLLLRLLEKAGIVEYRNGAHHRVRYDVEVVQTGDLVSLNRNTEQHDLVAVLRAPLYIDTFLWGNHDYAMMDPERHSFAWYLPPTGALRERLEAMPHNFALLRHGHIITHAGLHSNVVPPQPPDVEMDTYLEGLVAGLNVKGEEARTIDHPEINNCSHWNGGRHEWSGLLWRRPQEGLALLPQVFGHTPAQHPTMENGNSYNLDVSSFENCAGLWLPSREMVELNAPTS